MAGTISIYCIPNNNLGKRPRKPLVQIIASRGYGCDSFSFDPKIAPALTKAIRAAAKAAKEGRKLKTVEIEIDSEFEPCPPPPHRQDGAGTVHPCCWERLR